MPGPTAVRRRARPMSADERREVLVDATLHLLHEHGRALTTRQIAAAAGVAEGTIFRVVASKDELVDAAIARAFEPGQLLARLEAVDRSLPLRDRLVAATTILQHRFRATFTLMSRCGLVRPPDHLHDSAGAVALRGRLAELISELVGSDADRLVVPVPQLVHTLRLLTFAGSHPQISDGQVLAPEEIVDTVLLGLTRRDS